MINKTENSRFDYGDAVKIKATAPEKFYPGQVGNICGMDKITVDAEAQELFSKIGDWAYTVELPNGSSIEVAGCYLEVDSDRLKYKIRDQVIIKKDFSEKNKITEIVSVIDYHKISGKSLAKKFNLKIGCFIYVVENQSGQISLIPEYLIEKKY